MHTSSVSIRVYILCSFWNRFFCSCFFHSVAVTGLTVMSLLCPRLLFTFLFILSHILFLTSLSSFHSASMPSVVTLHPFLDQPLTSALPCSAKNRTPKQLKQSSADCSFQLLGNISPSLCCAAWLPGTSSGCRPKSHEEDSSIQGT